MAVILFCCVKNVKNLRKKHKKCRFRLTNFIKIIIIYLNFDIFYLFFVNYVILGVSFAKNEV